MAQEKVIWGTPQPNDRVGDLHTHSLWVKGQVTTDGRTPPWLRVEQAIDKGHDFVAHLDHDNIGPSIEAFEYNERYGRGLDVPYGCAEITVLEGKKKKHILAYGLQDNIPFNLPLEEAILRIHGQKGFVVAAHALCRYARGVSRNGLLAVAQHENPDIYWDGVEGFNGVVHDYRLLLWLSEFRNPNDATIRTYKKYREKGGLGILIGGSDDHDDQVGRVVTRIPHDKTVLEAFRDGVETSIIFSGGWGKYSLSQILHQQEAGRELERSRDLILGPEPSFPR